MIDYVAYYRVSTQRQGVSGLGLEAQRTIVNNYIKLEDIIVKEFTDIQTGTGRFDDRKELVKALDLCAAKGYKLIVAKLDRLSRDVHFISGLQKSNIDFVICNLPDANKFTIHIFAALAEQEALFTSERTKAALNELKKKGIKLGSPYYSPDAKRKKGKVYEEPLGHKERCKSIEVRRKNSRNNENYRKAIQWVRDMRRDGKSLADIATLLTEAGFKTSAGKDVWSAVQVSRMLITMKTPIATTETILDVNKKLTK